ncbi:MAG TPA: aminotransferase class I/II-fold pyridoxal phosphate-dependent enzyme, partial [Erysipelotrichaceae bacterium]|nr:aminotransferase class I/II-fold pyridoxal phosphate-dependent enzyme [Erysipelotrichaceae bacterium]
MKISNRGTNMKYSAIRELNPFANKAKSRGIKVNPLNIGVPDLETPQVFLDSIKNYQAKTIGYAPSLGLEDLRFAISNFFINEYNLEYSLDEIIVTGGASEALMFILMSVCDYGDNIVTINPYYSNYLSYFNQAGVNLKVFDSC